MNIGKSLRLSRFFTLYKYPKSIISRCRALSENDDSIPRKEIKKIDKILRKKLITKRSDGIEEITHHNNITLFEIDDFVNKINKEDGSDIRLEQTYNTKALIKSFLPYNNKDEISAIVEIRDVSSDGYGLAIVPKSDYTNFSDYTILKVPKVCKGETVRVSIGFHHEFYAETQLLDILQPSQLRDNTLIKCGYFSTCSGCQFQMMPYESQLSQKSETIQKAYRYFHPELQLQKVKIFESPLKYGYRTKLTPHFFTYKNIVDKVGFESVNKNHHGVNVKQCPIATKEINSLYSSLLPQVLKKPPKAKQVQFTIKQSFDADRTIAVEGLKNLITEKANGSLFQYSSTCFFQTNNSVLSPLFRYIKAQLENERLKYIVDTYCGVGLFGISLSKLFNCKVIGIEISQEQIKYAEHNVRLNNLDPEEVQFISGDASDMFGNERFKKMNITGMGSLVIIDPSRKGSNMNFLKQLVQFQPDIIIYVSCNVFTQARDLALLSQLSNSTYKVKDIVGFDFFPQTKHIETVAILTNTQNR